jgi:NDP-sugar pyrophosphorylase family protein
VKAIILAAGKGTRMRELTNELPKPMLKVRGRPILEHIVAITTPVCGDFIVTGFRADVIESHFGNGESGTLASRMYQVVQDGIGKVPGSPKILREHRRSF